MIDWRNQNPSTLEWLVLESGNLQWSCQFALIPEGRKEVDSLVLLSDVFLFLSALEDSAMMLRLFRMAAFGLCRGEENKNFGGGIEWFGEGMSDLC